MDEGTCAFRLQRSAADRSEYCEVAGVAQPLETIWILISSGSFRRTASWAEREARAELPCHSCVNARENCNETVCVFDYGLRLDVRGRLRDYPSRTYHAASAGDRQRRQRC